jgi:hypothetical protein
VFERFTEAARQVVILAQDEARLLKQNYIGVEHILLGLLREEDGIAARVLDSLDITVQRVRAEVVRIVGSGEEVTAGQIPFTPRAKKVLELALREALSLSHNYVGTEHILLGLMRENEGIAARILLDFDADSEKIRNEVIRFLSRSGGTPGSYVPPDTRTALLPESLLDWAGEPLHRLSREIESGLSRRADAGDLLVLLALVDGGVVSDALADLGLDVEQIVQAAERARAAGQVSELAPDPALLAECETVRAEKETAIASQEFERAADLRDRERRLRRRAREVAYEQRQEQLLLDVRTRLGLGE